MFEHFFSRIMMSSLSCAGKKALFKHNVYGLGPNIGSAHHLLVFEDFCFYEVWYYVFINKKIHICISTYMHTYVCVFIYWLWFNLKTSVLKFFVVLYLQSLGFIWLQMYAKQHNDVNLMVDIMRLVQKNDLPLQPGTADLVLR